LNNRGSSIITLAVLFTVMITMIATFINITKNQVTKAEINSLSVLWGKAILSEYDINLYNDYGIMAYFGNENDISGKLNKYCSYTFKNRGSIDYEGVSCDLSEYRLIVPENFMGTAQKSILSDNNKKTFREEKNGTNIIIKNKAIIETLPSINVVNENNYKVLKDLLLGGTDFNDITDGCIELAYITKYFNNHLYVKGKKDCVFDNEWEYILNGSMDDNENYEKAKLKIWLLRNALNLSYLYKDAEKRQLTLTIAETICPGPWCVATQFLIMESWAVMETEWDIKTLLKGEKVPIIKTKDTWNTDIDSVLRSDAFMEKLTDEEKDNMKYLEDNYENEKKTDFGGLDYEEYLMMYIALMNDDIRLFRMMDLIQINMKYRYYNDFNFKEYNNGLTFFIKANGNVYEKEITY